jgi:membrane protease YdiL (CAAX protease family)
MALSLGEPAIPGNPAYVRRAGGLLLACLLPYYALAIVDGFFLPQLARNAGAFAAYDLAKFLLLPCAILLILRHRLRLGVAALCLIGRGSDYRGWELAVLTFWWSGFLYVVYVLGEPLVTIPLGLLLALPHGALALVFDLPPLDLQFGAQFTYTAALPDDALLRAAVVLFFSASAGVVEEIFFRGLLRQAVAALLGPTAVKTYIIGSALLFGLAHWEQGSVGLFRAIAFGIAAAILYLKLDDLRPLILAHALIDLYIFW